MRTVTLAAALAAVLAVGASAGADVIALTITGTVASNGITVGDFAGAQPGDPVELYLEVDSTPLDVPCCDHTFSGPSCCGLIGLYQIDDSRFELTVAGQTIYSNAFGSSLMWLGAGWFGQDEINLFTTSFGLDSYSHQFNVIDQSNTTISSPNILYMPPFIPATAMQDGGYRELTDQTFPIWEIDYNNNGVNERLLVNFDGGITADGVVPPPPCPCNRDADEAVNVFDLLAYLSDWFAQSPDAELDGIGGVDVFDLLAYLDCWFSASSGLPCP